MTNYSSQQAVEADTGRTIASWMDVLSREAEKDWSHGQLVDYLTSVYEVGIEPAGRIADHYEEFKGNKPVGKTASAGYQVGVRRTYPVTAEAAWAFLTSPEGMKLWLGGLPALDFQPGQTFQSDEGISGEMRVVKPMQQLRLTWKKKDWDRPSTLQIRLIPTATGKLTISFHQENMADFYVRDEMKQYWENAAAVLQEKLG
ncbi:SRPBCC domain-containing protein [Paenibacillus sp. NPDC056579]|uniref:SRPBCC family protein n=1 Tax=Paenibacillus sp. NPDC056579 TaxID=3345871 RepID=UPI003687FA28